jgi:hypothetical protein
MYAQADDGTIHHVKCDRVPDDATVHVAVSRSPSGECECHKLL